MAVITRPEGSISPILDEHVNPDTDTLKAKDFLELKTQLNDIFKRKQKKQQKYDDLKELSDLLLKNYERGFITSRKLGKNLAESYSLIRKADQLVQKILNSKGENQILDEVHTLLKSALKPEAYTRTQKTLRSQTQRTSILEKTQLLLSDLQALNKEMGEFILTVEDENITVSIDELHEIFSRFEKLFIYHQGDHQYWQPLSKEKIEQAFNQDFHSITLSERKDLEKPVQRKLHYLQGLISKEEEKKFPGSHLETVSYYTRETEQDILHRIEERQQYHRKRIERHDDLAKIWGSCLIFREKIHWQLKKLSIISSTMNRIKTFNAIIDTSQTKINRLKEHCRFITDSMKGEEKGCIESLKNIQERFEPIKKSFLSSKRERETLESILNEIINSLNESSINDINNLENKLNGIEIFNEGLKQELKSLFSNASNEIKAEVRTLMEELKREWSEVQSNLSNLETDKIRVETGLNNGGILPYSTTTYYYNKFFGGTEDEVEQEGEKISSPH